MENESLPDGMRPAQADAAIEQVCRLKGGLRLPEPWDLAVFLDAVGVELGKPIRVIAEPDLTADGHPCGILIERETDFVIAYDATSSGYHAEHIVLHEVAHLLLNHRADPARPPAGANIVEALLPECDPDSVLRVLARTDYDEVQENQAELFASLVMADSRHPRPRSLVQRVFFRD